MHFSSLLHLVLESLSSAWKDKKQINLFPHCFRSVKLHSNCRRIIPFWSGPLCGSPYFGPPLINPWADLVKNNITFKCTWYLPSFIQIYIKRFWGRIENISCYTSCLLCSCVNWGWGWGWGWRWGWSFKKDDLPGLWLGNTIFYSSSTTMNEGKRTVKYDR